MFVRVFRLEPYPRSGGTLEISIALTLMLVVSCAHPERDEQGSRIHTDDAPSSVERYCSWYGDARNAVLYFGTSAFWSAMRSHGNDPMADLLEEGPVAIGRFDLRRERMLEPLEVGTAGNRSGVWDVLAHPNGRIYFTTFYESAGYADVQSGRSVRLPDLGVGLNELALGPDGGVLASRYGSALGNNGDGTIVSFNADGTLLAEFPLRAPDGYRVAPKTVAFDPVRGDIWATTDLLSCCGYPNQKSSSSRSRRTERAIARRSRVAACGYGSANRERARRAAGGSSWMAPFPRLWISLRISSWARTEG